jgi:hypothetical protein
MRHTAAALTLGLLLAATAAAQPAAASPAPDKASKPRPAVSTGYDVSYPQCGTSLPSLPRFSVVGVDGGRVLKPNPCLTTLIIWARSATEPAPSYYLNTGNPGPLVSSYWPSGQQVPRVCAESYPVNDSEACAYDYGWNAAQDSITRAAAAAAIAGAPDPATATWWLDVETGNSWESLQYGSSPAYLANDTAALQGMVDQLRAHGVSTVGAYSTTSQWTAITGGASLGGVPVWYAGVGTLAQAQSRCSSVYSFTGGPVTLTQYASSGFDADWRC